MTYDVDALRANFPALASGIAHFDGPGGTQTPRVVGEAIAGTLTRPLSNQGTTAASELNAQRAVDEFRDAYADLLGAPADGIVYGRSATQIGYDFSRHLAKTWGPGDEVVVSRLDHDANVRPWVQAAAAAGAELRWLEIDPATGDFRPESVREAITERTRLVAVTAASNLLGTRPDVAGIAARAHDVGALVYVDGVHYAAHGLVDVAGLGADFFVCSPYKFLGPHCAVLAADPGLLETITPDKLAPSSNDVPDRFEFGTLPYEILAGATAAVDFLADIAPGAATGRRARLESSLAAVEEHENLLRARIEESLAGLSADIDVHSRASDRTPTLLLTFARKKSRDAAAFLAAADILAPDGSFYAYEPFRALGLADDDALRIGLAPYTDDAEVDRLVRGLADFVAA